MSDPVAERERVIEALRNLLDALEEPERSRMVAFLASQPTVAAIRAAIEARVLALTAEPQVKRDLLN